MTQTATISQPRQRMRALERANQVRLARAQLKRRIADGDVTAAEIILACPKEASSWPVVEVLLSQRHWGDTRCRNFLHKHCINEMKPLEKLTDRQRRLLANELGRGERLAAAEPELVAV